MVREELLRTLLRLVLEEGGAPPGPGPARARRPPRRRRGGRLRGDAAAPRRRPAAARTSPTRCSGTCSAPTSACVLDDAAADAGRFAGDAYLARARPRSVLCLPIRRQAEVVALLYLENDLVPGTFTPERLLALELLAAQAAISLENALLLERERAARVEAEAAERASPPARRGHGGDDRRPSTTRGCSAALTRLCVRSFADWAVIDLVEAGNDRPAGGSAPRSRQGAAAARAGGALPAGRPLACAGGAACSTAASRCCSPTSATRNAGVGYAVDEHHVELIGQLGAGSAIVVPLIARDTSWAR